MHRAYSGEEGNPFRMVYTAQVMMSSRHHLEAEHEKRHEQRRVLLPEQRRQQEHDGERGEEHLADMQDVEALREKQLEGHHQKGRRETDEHRGTAGALGRLDAGDELPRKPEDTDAEHGPPQVAHGAS